MVHQFRNTSLHLRPSFVHPQCNNKNLPRPTPPHLYSILIYTPSSLSRPLITHASESFCMHSRCTSYPTIFQLGPFPCVIYNTWCYLPSIHVVKLVHGICCKRLRVVPLCQDGLSESVGFTMLRSCFVCTGAIISAFWSVLLIQS